MKYIKNIALLLVVVLTVISLTSDNVMAGGEKTGFLVIAPDRGYQGNEETLEVTTAFEKTHLARLVFVTLQEDYAPQVQTKLLTAVKEMKAAGAHDVVLLPLLLSPEDPYLKRVKALMGLGAPKGSATGSSPDLPIRVAPTMGDDLLIAQVLEDTAGELSQDPSKERLVIVGWGATNQEEAQAIEKTLLGLAERVKAGLPFAETHAIVFYQGQTVVSEELSKKANQEAKEALQQWARDQRLKTLVVPFGPGWKHTGSMQFKRSIANMIKELQVAFNGKEALPHPNFLRWLNKTAAGYLPPQKSDLGIVLMPHGSGAYHNEPILQAIAPLRAKYPIEVAWGMADVETLQAAIGRLEAAGARRILVLRVYDQSLSLKEDTEYVLGISHHHGDMGRMQQVRSGAILTTSGGWDADPLMAQVLLERTIEVSQSPEKETVILLAHGAGSDEKDIFWLKQMQAQADYIQTHAPKRFKEVKAATLREDWPEKRKDAVEKIRQMVTEAGKDGGRALVISNRIAGPGPYRKYLTGLEYVFNGAGIAPHPNLTKWLDRKIHQWMEEVLHTGRPLADAGAGSKLGTN